LSLVSAVVKPSPGKLNPSHDAAAKRMLATPPQPRGVVLFLTATKKKPRALAGLKLKEIV
jgi:hypothetical protein